MKKNVFFIIFILLFGIASSQVFIDNVDAMRTTSIMAGTDRLSAYTQKVLYWSKDQHVILSQNVDGKSVFALTKNGTTEIVEDITLSSYFNVKDFAIEGDTLYFCGNVIVDGSNVAFLAYVGIGDLFKDRNLLDSIKAPHLLQSGIKYTLINNAYEDSIYSIDRIEVFKDATNTVVAGIGKMYYGEPPYEVMHPNSNGDITFELKNPHEYYLDFFMLYTIKEDSAMCNLFDVLGGATPNYDIANDFEMFYVLSDTTANCYHNKFADITETDSKIYLISVNYSNTTFSNPLIHSSYIDIISFDKQTRQQQTGRVNLPSPIHQAYGVKATHTTKENIAIVYNTCYDPLNQYSCAFAIMPDEHNSFISSKISIFDTLPQGFKIYDCEYLEEEEELVVLKKSVFNDQKEDLVFHLKMNDTINYPYDYIKYKINFEDSYGLCCNDLNVSNTYDYTVAGYISENRILIYETKINSYSYDYHCINKDMFRVALLDPFQITQIPQLKQCRFYSPTLVQSDSNYQPFIQHLSKLKLNVFIKYYLWPFKRNSEINIHCLK
ncbi:MAG: hypothetical protein J6U84_04790 [Bacteroidales bacterium]|nr:hypothetical protein [Bacteroidales bacterium]